ncbi:hypothetical protein CSB45_00675 [candidate division KSB3 bacterium]|uniref:Uncharacterized protein n=1 Tax=candidate division KSB3 bacterium TaxID=2044937 RepID=A0A2G6EDI0_9BACT|nr:MAG: hypothetical protein CSB45_00675 [candidate division KSB3 bacterium]PIE31028.1 MAG: hypothetical protein CSA57_01545 [candidate division KSB3 bacterium]
MHHDSGLHQHLRELLRLSSGTHNGGTKKKLTGLAKRCFVGKIYETPLYDGRETMQDDRGKIGRTDVCGL